MFELGIDAFELISTQEGTALLALIRRNSVLAIQQVYGLDAHRIELERRMTYLLQLIV